MSDFIDLMPSVFRNGSYSCTYNPDPKAKPNCSNDKGDGSITKSFTLYKYRLPVMVQSKANPISSDGLPNSKYSKGEDKTAQNLISGYGIPIEGYSDSHASIVSDDNGNISIVPNRDPKLWPNFNEALTKCIQLDGTNGKPNCYAVIVQTDYDGITDNDSNNLHTFKYNLVENPNYNNTELKNILKISPRVDSNLLYCQGVYYTWIKNLDNNQSYNTSEYNTPASTLNCSVAQFAQPGAIPKLDPNNGKPTSLKTPRASVEIPFVPPDRPKKNNNNTLIIGGVVASVVILGGIYFWYTRFGPGVTPAAATPNTAPLPIPSTPSIKITKKGGYFYY